MLNPLARVAQQYKLEKTKEENITKRKIFDLTEKLAYAVARYSKESQINILKAIAVKEGELGSFIANRVAKLLNLNLFEKTADITVTIPEEIEKFFRGIKKFIKIAQDDDEGHERPVKPMESVELRKIVAKSIEASLDPLVVVAKLKEIAKADPSFAALFDQYPKRTFNSAMMLLQTYPWLIDRPALLASLVKRMTSHSGLEPSELITIGHKSLKTDPFIESVVKSAAETDRELEIPDLTLPEWLGPILARGAETAPWWSTAVVGAFTNPLVGSAAGLLGFLPYALFSPESKDKWQWTYLANLLPIIYALRWGWRTTFPKPKNIPYDVKIPDTDINNISKTWLERPGVRPWRIFWRQDVKSALRILANKNFLETDFSTTTAPPGTNTFRLIFEQNVGPVLEKYKNAFNEAINVYKVNNNTISTQQTSGTSPEYIFSRFALSTFDAIHSLARSSGPQNARKLLYDVYTKTFDGISRTVQISPQNVQNLKIQEGEYEGGISKLIVERGNDNITFKLELLDHTNTKVVGVLDSEARLFRDVFESGGKIKKDYPFLTSLYRDIENFKANLGLPDSIHNSKKRLSFDEQEVLKFLESIEKQIKSRDVTTRLDNLRVLGTIDYNFGRNALGSALYREELKFKDLFHPKRLVASRAAGYGPLYGRGAAALGVLITTWLLASSPEYVRNWLWQRRQPPPPEEKKVHLLPAHGPESEDKSSSPRERPLNPGLLPAHGSTEPGRPLSDTK
jgi:hypothetical protein